MADFIIPRGKEYVFTVKVIEKDSLIAQDVEGLDEVNSKVEFMRLGTNVCVTGSTITIARVPDDALANPLTYVNGIVKVTIPASYTALMETEMGDKVDNYYLKPTYRGIFSLVFTDGTPNRVVVLEKVYVTLAGC